MSQLTSSLNHWWEKQSQPRRVFSRMLLMTILGGHERATWLQCEGSFYGLPSETDGKGITQRLGHRRFNMVLRELVKQGLTIDQTVVFSVPCDHETIDVEVALNDIVGDNEIELNFKWDRVTKPNRLKQISELVAKFPLDRDYRAVRGRVVDWNGQPVGNAEIVTQRLIDRSLRHSPSGRDPLGQMIGGCLTNSRGEFELQLIHNDEHWREDGIEIIAISETVKGVWQQIDDETGMGDIENVEVQLPEPAELMVQFDLEQDDVVAPFQLHIEKIGRHYWESHFVQSSGEREFSNLAPGTYLVSIHQMSDDLARQIVELKSNETVVCKFAHPQKIELRGEIVCAQRPEGRSSLEFGIRSKHESPLGGFRESERGNFDDQRIEVWPDLFQPTQDGRWSFTFPIRNLVGGFYEVKLSLEHTTTSCPSDWQKFACRERTKTILIVGDPPTCEPVDMIWKVDEEQTIRFRLTDRSAS